MGWCGKCSTLNSEFSINTTNTQYYTALHFDDQWITKFTIFIPKSMQEHLHNNEDLPLRTPIANVKSMKAKRNKL